MPSRPERSLAEKLEELFGEVRRPDGRPYSNREVAGRIAEGGGPRISGTYIWQLRKGQRANPTVNHVAALAAFFGVPPAYLNNADRADVDEAQIELTNVLRDDGVKRLALLAHGVSAETLAAVGDLLEYFRRVEGLPVVRARAAVRRRRG